MANRRDVLKAALLAPLAAILTPVPTPKRESLDDIRLAAWRDHNRIRIASVAWDDHDPRSPAGVRLVGPGVRPARGREAARDANFYEIERDPMWRG